MRTGGVQLPTLSYEQARDFVSSVAQISRRPINLFLDQWEKSPDAALESKTLDSFLTHLDDWPLCHIFMALRADEPAHGEVEKLADVLPGTAEIYPLHDMDLGLDEGRRLTAFVRGTVSAAGDQSDENLLGLVDGFPGVLYRWTSDYQREHMKSLQDLESVAKAAQEYRFSELNKLLPGLDGDRRRIAIRVALQPLSDRTWPILRKEWLGGLSEGLIDELALATILEGRDPPGFGHAKRWEAARDWFLMHRRADARSELEDLISCLAGPIRIVDRTTEPYAATLRSLLPSTLELGAGDVFVAACQAAATLFGHRSASDEIFLRGAVEARSGALTTVAPLFAIAAFNTLNDAKAEGNLARRDALLDELRALAAAHPEDAAVCELLARGLYNTLSDAKAKGDLARRDALLDELRALAAAHTEDSAVRDPLGRSLFDTLNDAKAEHDLARRDALLDELRALAATHPADAALRKQLTRGLFNTLSDAKAEGNLARRDALLDELRALAAAHPADAVVREQLARGLFNTRNDTKAEHDLPRRDALLDELCALAKAHHEDAALREWLAKGLYNTRNDTKAEHDLARRDALLDELRALAKAHSADAAVREKLAMGLLNTLNYAEAEDDLARRDALLETLRALTKAHPEDAAVRQQLAMGLCNTMLGVADEGQPERWEYLLKELNSLAQAHPEDSWVEQLRSAGLLE
jgi:hypothetical protein